MPSLTSRARFLGYGNRSMILLSTKSRSAFAEMARADTQSGPQNPKSQNWQELGVRPETGTKTSLALACLNLPVVAAGLLPSMPSSPCSTLSRFQVDLPDMSQASANFCD